MKKFLLNSIAMGGAVLIVSVIIELLLLTQTNVYSYKREYMEHHLNDIKVLFLGNSYIEEAIIPSEIGESVFNLAIKNQNKRYDIELAKKYIPKMDSLKVVVMPFDYKDFYFGRQMKNPRDHIKRQNKNRYKACMYYKYMGLRIDGFWNCSELLWSEEDYMSRFVRTEKENRGCDSLGYQKLDYSRRRADWAYCQLPDIVNHSKRINKRKKESLYNSYSLMAQLTRGKRLRLILLSTPMYKTYQDNMSQIIVDEMYAFVNKLKQEYPHVEYYDLSKDDRFLSEDFQDASHMSENGAVKLSKIMSAIIGNEVDNS